MTIKILDLFAGVGGLSLGFELIKDKAGKKVFELHRAVEIDKYACETLRNRHGDDKVIEGDLTKKKIHEKVIKECKERVSIVVGGIPCQSFSLIGPRSGYGLHMDAFRKDRRDNLYKEFRDIVREIKPKIVVIENVKGILSKKNGKKEKVITRLLSDFEKLGYNFENEDGNKYLLLNAADYGVPQKRERVILIGLRKNWKNIKMPRIEPTHFDLKEKNPENLMKKGLNPYVTLYDAIGDLPEVTPKTTYTDLSESKKEKVKRSNEKMDNGTDKIALDLERYMNHLENISLSGKGFFEFVRPNGYQYIDHHIARSQQISDIKLFGLLKEGETAKDFMERSPKMAEKLIKYDMSSFRDKYRKQKSDEPSTTVFAHLEKDGNRFIHPTKARTYTPREAARIQSFPDDFIFAGPLSKKFRQIGNAVPPLMSINIAKTIERIFS